MEQERRQGNSFLIEMEDGFLVRVPEEKMEAWQRADHRVPLTPEDQRFKERLLASLYSSRR